jgi:hypothetical protein
VATRSAIPTLAHTLGYAGLLPQAAALLILLWGNTDYRYSALAFAFAYGALILSFLGALWWGLAAAQPDAAPEWIWPAGVLPCLIALAIAATLFVDRRLCRLELCPPGWLRLRARLSSGLALLTALCALA